MSQSNEIILEVQHLAKLYGLNRPEAIRWAVLHARPGDTVLLAGKGHETYQILKSGIIHLDEREVVAEALQESGD